MTPLGALTTALAWLLLGTATGAHAADAVVGLPCSEATFDSALATVQNSGGGTLSFACGGSVTIFFSAGKAIASNVTIDGGTNVTLSGGNTTRLFTVRSMRTLTLVNITLSNGFSTGDGGAIFNDFGGTLVLANVTMRNSLSALSGGAILSLGSLTITDSVFEGNRALNGGALYTRFNQAVTEISGTIFRHNMATDETDGFGGAILNWFGSSITIRGGEIHGNTALLGGGLLNTADSTVSLLENAVVRDNAAQGGESASGGGIYNLGALTASGATIRDNVAFAGGGGIHNLPGASLTIVDSIISGNRATDGAGSFGGGIANGGTCTLDRVTLRDNQSSYRGGGISNSMSLTVRNSTLSGNSAQLGGGLITFGGSVSLEFVTIAGNAATTGAGILKNGSGSVGLRNVILDNAGPGGECALGAGATTMVSAGYNLAGDSGVPCALSHVTDRTFVDPQLSALGDGGGPTPTMTPGQDSPAVDGGLCVAGIVTDQRGIARPQGAACDIGAVERAPEESSTTTTTTSTVTSTLPGATTSTALSIPGATTSTTLPVSVHFPEARRLKTTRKASGRQRLLVVLGGPDVATETPCDVGGVLVIQAVGAGTPSVTIPLEASGWTPLKAKRPEKGCRYRGGAVATAVVKVGRVLKVKARSETLGLPLTQDPRPVRIEVRHGTVRHCAEFGGRGRYKLEKKLVATGGPAGGACPASDAAGANLHAASVTSRRAR